MTDRPGAPILGGRPPPNPRARRADSAQSAGRPALSDALTTRDYAAAAAALGCSPRQIRAVVAVEAAGSGFTTHRGERVPKLLFEPHLFYRNSGAYPVSRVAPHLSRRSWRPGTYNQLGGRRLVRGEDAQHVRLEQAVALDAHFSAGGAVRDAALASCSWGIGQVLGSHWRSLGYGSLQAFVNAQYTAAGQLDTFVRFVRANGLADELRRVDGRPANARPFARRYNGPAYAVHGYDRRIARAYRELG